MNKSWTIKEVEHWRIDAFELWCWRRLLGIPWTVRRSNQSIPKGNQPWIFIGGWGELFQARREHFRLRHWAVGQLRGRTRTWGPRLNHGDEGGVGLRTTWGLFQLCGAQAKEQGHGECHKIEELQELELPRLWEKLRKQMSRRTGRCSVLETPSPSPSAHQPEGQSLQAANMRTQR